MRIHLFLGFNIDCNKGESTYIYVISLSVGHETWDLYPIFITLYLKWNFILCGQHFRLKHRQFFCEFLHVFCGKNVKLKIMGKYLKIFEVKITFCESIFVFVVRLRNIGKMLKILDFIDDIIHIHMLLLHI